MAKGEISTTTLRDALRDLNDDLLTHWVSQGRDLLAQGCSCEGGDRRLARGIAVARAMLRHRSR